MEPEIDCLLQGEPYAAVDAVRGFFDGRLEGILGVGRHNFGFMYANYFVLSLDLYDCSVKCLEICSYTVNMTFFVRRTVCI